MSELSELIEITKNIEKQNTEIIRLLKKIAGEEDDALSQYKSLLEHTPDFGELYISNDKPVESETSEEEVLAENKYQIGTLLENSLDVGEVYFIEDSDIFKLSIEEGESVIENLTGDSQPSNFALHEVIANESVENDVSLDDNSVLLSSQQSENLPETLRISVEQGARKIYMPLYSSAGLVGASENLMQIVKFEFFKTEEELIEKLFKN